MDGLMRKFKFCTSSLYWCQEQLAIRDCISTSIMFTAGHHATFGHVRVWVSSWSLSGARNVERYLITMTMITYGKMEKARPGRQAIDIIFINHGCQIDWFTFSLAESSLYMKPFVGYPSRSSYLCIACKYKIFQENTEPGTRNMPWHGTDYGPLIHSSFSVLVSSYQHQQRSARKVLTS
jgi:hypothetical protein